MKLVLKGANLVFQAVKEKVTNYLSFINDGNNNVTYHNASFERSTIRSTSVFIDGIISDSDTARYRVSNAIKSAIPSGGKRVFKISGKVTVPNYIECKYAKFVIEWKEPDYTLHQIVKVSMTNRKDTYGNLVYEFDKDFEFTSDMDMKYFIIRVAMDTQTELQSGQYYAKIENFNFSYETYAD